MSSHVTLSEWSDLIPVPPENYSFWIGPCDADVEHGQAHYFLQTRDHRAIALCMRCYEKTNKPNGPDVGMAGAA